MHEVAEVIENHTGDVILLVVEPWGDQCILGPGEIRTIRMSAPEKGSIEVEHNERLVTVYGWPGATAEVWDGSRIVQRFPIAVPAIPAGQTVRGFLRIFGTRPTGS